MFAKNREIGKAGWGYTLITTIVGLIYFFPVLWIIMTAFKTRADALATPPVFFFTPTLDNFVSVFWRVSQTGTEAISTGMGLYFFNSLFVQLIFVCS